MERGHLPQHPAPHLADRLRDGPPLPRRPGQGLPRRPGKIDYMAIIGDNQVRTANICAYTCHAINGVSKLHSEIIKDSVFHDYFLYKPQAFKNVTNGIATAAGCSAPTRA